MPDPLSPPTFDLETRLPGPVAGVDEAGRGPWAGPVVAAAAILDPTATPEGLNDSKKLTDKRRRALAAELRDVATVGVGVASVEEIDEINIREATFLAMQRAIAALSVPPAHALVDGNAAPQLSCPATTVIKGDALSLSIAAASIIAKVARDDMMDDLAGAFPGYEWERNKGYGAPAHKAGLLRHGVTPHHRRTFKPIRDMLGAAPALGGV